MAQTQALASGRNFCGFSIQEHRSHAVQLGASALLPPPLHKQRRSTPSRRELCYSQQQHLSHFSIPTCRLSEANQGCNNEKEVFGGRTDKLNWSEAAQKRTQRCRSSGVGVEAFQEQARGLQGDGTLTLSKEEERETLPGTQPAQKDANQSAPGGDDFKWAENWYPIAVERDMRKELPFAVTILGKPLVLWWDRNKSEKGQSGGWRAFLDMCPHRLAPLSEGKFSSPNFFQNFL